MIMRNKELNLFLYWITERHSIFLKKEAGKNRPWTDDSILNEYKFTNPFRENDRVTRELRKRIKKSDSTIAVFKKIIIFRMFNWSDTYDLLDKQGLIKNYWDCKQAIMFLEDHKKAGNKIFTGAYIITGGGSSKVGRSKIYMVCNAIDDILYDAKEIVAAMYSYNSLEQAVDVLLDYNMVGRFIGYELVTDIRHTAILNKATDIYTWANPGPGAKRGTHRILFGTVRGELPKKTRVDYQVFMQDLMHLTQRKLGKKAAFKNVRFEMRDIEHSLCEFDKYMRVKNSEGRPRSKYR